MGAADLERRREVGVAAGLDLAEREAGLGLLGLDSLDIRERGSQV